MRKVSESDPAITGAGVVCPIGFGRKAAWLALAEGRSGIRELPESEAPAGMRLAGCVEPPFLRVAVPDELQSQAKFLNTCGEMLVTAIEQAVEEARFAEANVAPERRGFTMCQSDTTRADCLDFRPGVEEATASFSKPLEAEALNRSTLHRVKPYFLLETLLNNAFSVVTAWHQLRGTHATLSGVGPLGAECLVLAARAVAEGTADVMLAAASARHASPTVRHEVHALRYASQGREGAASFRPLDRRRDGIVPGEGAGALVVERVGDALRRGREVLGVLVGEGARCGAGADGAYGPTADALEGAAREALEEAKTEPAELLGLVLPGLGSRAGDREALEAARRILGSRDVPVAAWKGATGHMAPASDLVEASLLLEALRTGQFPGTPGFGEAEPGFEHLRVSRVGVRRRGEVALLLAAGPDGQASAVCLARPPRE